MTSDTETPEKPKAHTVNNAAEHLRKQSLKAAGIGTLIADMALITFGFVEGSNKIGTAGVFGILAGTTGARYGNPKMEKRLEQVERRLGAYLKRQGVEIPKDPTTESLTKKEGVVDHIEDFIYKYPSQIMNVFYGAIGVQFARDGLENKIRSEGGALKKSPSMIISGSCLMAGALAGLLIKEKKPDPEHPPHGAIAKAVSWVQEKPLRVSGTLFNLNQIGLTIDAVSTRKGNKNSNSYLLKLLAVAGFTFGNVMMTLSPKSSGTRNKLDNATLGELATASASVIAAQPKQMQEAVLEQVAKHLATETNVQMDAKQISEMLHKKLAEIAPLQATGEWQERSSAPKDAQPQPTR